MLGINNLNTDFFIFKAFLKFFQLSRLMIYLLKEVICFAYRNIRNLISFISKKDAIFKEYYIKTSNQENFEKNSLTTKNIFSKKHRSILEDSFEKNKNYPYASPHELAVLATQTNSEVRKIKK